MKLKGTQTQEVQVEVSALEVAEKLRAKLLKFYGLGSGQWIGEDGYIGCWEGCCHNEHQMKLGKASTKLKKVYKLTAQLLELTEEMENSERKTSETA